MRSLFPACAATAACLATAAPALAAAVDGRTQLQLQTALVNAYGLTFEYDDSYGEEDDKETTFHRDIGFAPRFGIGIGRGFSEHGMFHLLGALALSSEEYDPGDSYTSKSSGVDFELTPSLRYVASGERARFFVGAGAGVSIANREEEDVASTTAIGALLSGFLGVHVFLNENVSLDPGLELSGVFMQSTFDPDEGESLSGSARGVRFLLSVGLSGWLGASKGEDAPREERALASEPVVKPRAEPVSDSFLSVTTPLQGFGLEVEGAPQLRGDALLVRTERLSREAAWSSCKIELRGGAAPIVIEGHHRASAGGSRGMLTEELSGMVDVRQLHDWLDGSPRVAVCDAESPVQSFQLARLREMFTRFVGHARAAGTFPVEVTPPPVEVAPPAEVAPPVEAAPAQPASPAPLGSNAGA